MGDNNDNEIRDEDTIESMLTPKARAVPLDIDHLEDALYLDSDGKPTLKVQVGGNLLIERWYKDRWLGTVTYKLMSIDPVTYDVQLYDADLMQSAGTNLITAPEHGWRFKIPGKYPLTRPKRRVTKCIPEED